MEFHLEVPQDHFFIRSVSEQGIRINEDYYKLPFIISGQRIIPEWNVESVDDINETNLQPVFDLQPEIILIGTIQLHFFRRMMGFEVMNTDAACRTFNVLASEGREVVAALIPVTS